MPRNNFADAESYKKTWFYWQHVWTWTNLLIGGTSVFFGTLVAIDTKTQFLGEYLSIGIAAAAPILTFVLTTLKPQAEAVAFKTAAREIEKALVIYKGDTSKEDIFLSEAITRGIDLLNKVGGA